MITACPDCHSKIYLLPDGELRCQTCQWHSLPHDPPCDCNPVPGLTVDSPGVYRCHNCHNLIYPRAVEVNLAQ